MMRNGAYEAPCITITQNVQRRQRDSLQKMPVLPP